MPVRTYIPTIKIVADFLKKYLAKHSAKLQQYMGEGVYSILVLVVDLVVILAAAINVNSDVNGNYGDPVSTLNSSQINQIQGAYVKWLEANGLGEG